MASQEERSTAEEGWGKGPRGRETQETKIDLVEDS